ncbi:uncharacterized protein C8Q71DRAFT_781673 [Rhodofomes roseus]|uniref:Secreted protein n=1 Tax=Rhodofomes roseus TaxID=34475 RepID=A0ABQ8K3Y6_9APHY|nr:uncharacterized protein C8Q71DRAFT_781673 [Rhodofomes roseus]KAH9831618.1 hypothetical protein C8Q71DRAFT_781673 [Rhodofomes roseus]
MLWLLFSLVVVAVLGHRTHGSAALFRLRQARAQRRSTIVHRREQRLNENVWPSHGARSFRGAENTQIKSRENPRSSSSYR